MRFFPTGAFLCGKSSSHSRGYLLVVIATLCLSSISCTGSVGSQGGATDARSDAGWTRDGSGEADIHTEPDTLHEDAGGRADVQESADDVSQDTLDASDVDPDSALEDPHDSQDIADEEPEPVWPPWDYETGRSYIGNSDYVEYIAGDAPIILASPHGGGLEPSSIPPRTSGATVRDAYTQELTREVAEAYFQQTGLRPHVILNLLHRSRLDANREITEAAEGNSAAEQAWHEYHEFIEAAAVRVEEKFGAGLYIDIHGHGHEVQRVELGYLLSKADLQKSDSELNAQKYINKSSIRGLYEANADHLSFAELLRGPQSMGAFLEAAGFPSVPSDAKAAPSSSWSYFSGGYNTRRHGSVEDGPISAIQFECNQDVRFTESARLGFADGVATALRRYLEAHY